MIIITRGLYHAYYSKVKSQSGVSRSDPVGSSITILYRRSGFGRLITLESRFLPFCSPHRQRENGCDPNETPLKLRHNTSTWTLEGQQCSRGMQISPFAHLSLTE